MSRAVVCCCVLLLTTLQGVTAQQEWCQTILAASQLNALCEPVGNCTGLMCLLQDGNFDNSTASFQVHKCQDPVVVDLVITSSDGTVGFEREFNRTQTVIDVYHSAAIQVAVTVARNATHLNFSATLPTMQLIPPVLVPLNTTECMCESLEDFASLIQSPFEHDCFTNSDCNGIRCEFDIFGNVFFIDAIILPCIVPPAIEVLVENSLHEIISAVVFNRTEEKDIFVAGTSLPLDVDIIHRDYSMTIQASLLYPIFGRLELFPHHTIILDRTNCSNAPTGLPPTVATVTNTDATPTPPSTASQTCRALYEIVQRYTSEPFVCRLRENCDGFWCRLDILDTHYNISIQVAKSTVVDLFLVVLDEGREEISRRTFQNSNITVELPKPNNTRLGFASSLRGTTLGVKIDLVTSWPQGFQQRVTLLPYSELPVETGVTAQQEWCQTILAASQLNALCEPVGNCTGLMCLLQDGNFDGSTASFQVRKCRDPVVVDLMITSSDGIVGFEREFNRTQTVFDVYHSAGSGQSTTIQVAVIVARNATHLNFSATLPTMQLIPPVLVPLNTTECMCESLEDFASVIQSPFEHDCFTNSDCNGIRCELDIFGNVFYIDAIALPCIVPPAIEVLIENSQHEIISAAVFNRTEERDIFVAGTSLPLDVNIIHHEYSMDIQASLFHPLVGRLELFPYHTIILDRTNCSNAPTGLPPTVATVTNTDSTPTPPSTASQTCHALYEIVRRYTSEPFVCRLRENCDGFWCRLDILDTHYNISIQVAKSTVVDLFLVVLDKGGEEISRRTLQNSNITIELPKPDNTYLGFASSLRGTTLGVKIDLVTSWPQGSQQRVTLLPYSELPVETGVTAQQEWCQTILAASQLNALCEPVGNCTGLMCLLQDGNFDGSTASFQVRKCRDPVVVDLMITSSDDIVGFEREFNRTQTVFDVYHSAGSGQGTTIQVAVIVARNATHLNFSATLPTMQLIPPVLVPLNTTECMCESLEDFASVIQSPFEHDCFTNSDCNGIRCELDIFGNVFYIDAIALPCIVPPAIEVLIENSQHEIISAAVFNRTEERDIFVAGTSLPLDVNIIHRDYSMDIQASLSHPLVGRLELFPYHTIILDRTNCSNAPTGLPPTVATVTNTDATPTPPSTASQTCRALYEIVQRYTSEPFVCRLRENCDGFWCRLDILDTHYNISIQVAKSTVVDLFLVVLDESGEEISRRTLQNSNITIELPKPDNTYLGFASSLRGTTLGVKIDLVTSWPQGSQQRVTLLTYSELPVETAGSATPAGSLSDTEVKAIAVTVPIAVLLIVTIFATVLIFGCVHYYKNRHRVEQFQFKPMSYSDVKENEAELDAKGGEPPPGIFFGEEKKEDWVAEEKA